MRTRTSTWIASCLVVCAPPAAAQTATPIDIAVDATAAGTPLEAIWAYHGFDEVNYTTTAEGQALLETLGLIPPVAPHIRSHFLLNTGTGVPSLKWGSTNVYTVDATGNPVYDWTLMDGIMDTVTNAGAAPFAEIGFMPEALSSHPTPYQNSGIYTLDGGCFYPPTDYTRWAGLIQAWATHSNTRYPAVASTWQWELWNEPDIGYWQGTSAEYDELFDYTESALHQVIPNAPLGGPATSSAGAFLTQFLQHCATGTDAVTGEKGVRLDMVTFHAKGGVGMLDGNVEMNLGHQLQLHSDGFEIVAGFPQYKQTPIVISEADPDGCAACPQSQDAAYAYRTSPAYGAYEVAMMKHTLELEASLGVHVRGVLAWAFLFENEPYFSGYRVLSSHGIDLPVLNAYKLLGGLQGMTIPVTSTGALTLNAILANGVRGQADINAMATLNGQQIQVLVWNYHDDLIAVPASPIQLTVQVPVGFGSVAVVDHLRVDETHGDAYTTWVSQGSPAAPSAAQLLELGQAMVPQPLQPEQMLPVTAGTVSLTFDLPRFGLSLVSLYPPGDAPDGSFGSATADASLPQDGAVSAIDTPPPLGPSDASFTDGAATSSRATSSAASQGAFSSSASAATAAASAVPSTAAARTQTGCGCRVPPAERGPWGLCAWLPAIVVASRRRRSRGRHPAILGPRVGARGPRGAQNDGLCALRTT
ncbi:MAG: beta-xylosidase [Polyangiaceae bacterium]|jgi:xylan 1,4-beta-xylosidase